MLPDSGTKPITQHLMSVGSSGQAPVLVAPPAAEQSLVEMQMPSRSQWPVAAAPLQCPPLMPKDKTVDERVRRRRRRVGRIEGCMVVVVRWVGWCGVVWCVAGLGIFLDELLR